MPSKPSLQAWRKTIVATLGDVFIQLHRTGSFAGDMQGEQ
jgi:hypothetical protein